uniref:DNA dC->dU-editing enzyme APOBEC-3G n=1 Tax=Oryctolagus cuniculus TaxID=9986 RepID=G1TLT9_RABIT
MEDNAAPEPRPLLDQGTFMDHFANEDGGRGLNETYLCYEVQLLDGSSQHQGFLRNKPSYPDPSLRRHAELCFLDLVPAWRLDPAQHYRVTWFISWSPCFLCAQAVAEFLRRNAHVSLRIFAARIYTWRTDYKAGLQDLQRAGAQIAIMTPAEIQFCWNTFVDNQSNPFHSHLGLGHAKPAPAEGAAEHPPGSLNRAGALPGASRKKFCIRERRPRTPRTPRTPRRQPSPAVRRRPRRDWSDALRVGMRRF